ncbi:MAG TPA: hypothetical protein VMZ53_27935 [Kofleriaceae bacterium]|nr:hypothetical protein [Kofleriaceae bacterium]
MVRLFVVVTMLGLFACGGSPPPKQQSPQVRQSIARRELPADLAPLVPKHGAVATGGGVKSPSFRVIVDTDAKTISSAERSRELTPRNEQYLMQLCADAWSEPAPATPPDKVEGYEEFLIIADGDEVFFLEGHGPITRPAAAKAIEALRAAAAL